MTTKPESKLELEDIKRQAKRIKKAEQITHTAALERAAVEAGYTNYQHARRALLDVEPQRRAQVRSALSSFFKIQPLHLQQRLAKPSEIEPSREVMMAIVRIAERKRVDREGFLRFSMSDLAHEMGKQGALISSYHRRKLAGHIEAAMNQMFDLGLWQDISYNRPKMLFRARSLPELRGLWKPSRQVSRGAVGAKSRHK